MDESVKLSEQIKEYATYILFVSFVYSIGGSHIELHSIDSSNKDARNLHTDGDSLLKDYDSILKEAALLTTFTGILFGFLLNISVTSSSTLNLLEQVVLATALFSITIAASLFVMPVVYHHIQFPYNDLAKFKARAHRFIIFGSIPTAVTLFLGIVLAFFPIIGIYTFIIAPLPFLLVSVLYKMRK
jgi:hypothetical protein